MANIYGKNIFYAQSGGVTAVINATAYGVIKKAKSYPDTFNKIYAGKNGILGAINNEFYDIDEIPKEYISGLTYTPAGIFGSSRYKLPSLEQDTKDYKKILDNFKAKQIGYFLYNGGGDSQDTAYKLSCYANKVNYPLVCIGIPKTIDNDLAFTDNCPGYGSVAKYVAISCLEAKLDVISMHATSTKVFILEVMGRHAGWIAAAAGLANPDVILFPEIKFNQEKFLNKVKQTVSNNSYCIVVASEGVKLNDISNINNGNTDAFGHKQLGGISANLASLIKHKLKLKVHYAIADYLQRSAGHIISATDLEQSIAIGEAAINLAKDKLTSHMPIILRISNSPYKWKIDKVSLSEVANIEKKLNPEFITKDGFNITQTCREYIEPLIQGEIYPSYKNGLPDYIQL